MATLPWSYNDLMPLRFWWRPWSLSMTSAASASLPSVGRRSRYFGSPIGMTVWRPSLPPPSWIITRILSFVTPALFALYTAFANTSGTAAYPAARPRAPAPNTSPFPRKSRREILSMPMFCMPISISSLLQLELRRGEEDEPAGLVIARRVQQLRGRLADDPVDVRLVRVPER